MKYCAAVLTIICLLYTEAVFSEEVQPTFKYVTSYNKEGRFMTKNDIEKSSINVLKPIIFVIGGLTNDDKNGDSWSRDLQDAYLEKFIHNVFIVDWNVTSPLDSDALTKARSAGLTVADFIATIFNKTGEAYLDIHLVAVSLGCEVAASAAGRFADISSRKINRLTGLDPAYYLISNGNELKLSPENADFVDVVNTKLNGDLKQTGHVDIFVDGEGSNGPSSHGVPKSVTLFAKSVNSNDIKATKCDNLENFRKGGCNDEEQVTFGENIDKAARGRYFLKY
ncbi:hypothetical protein NQ315_012198 [Exocentrus adspersus]|uniref:Lipase domain-containing protein n=1 Tax=Exocentrus adspersus TaxID=1586481 RepID=A0AAV8VY88_9CUCU|nr:hypothetical protein NQ315_012198 [Exocentrus adspersus]